MKKILEWIQGGRPIHEDDHSSGRSVFPEIKKAELRRQLRLRHRGMERGGRNLPPSDAKNLDEVEQGVDQAIKSMAEEASNILNEQNAAFHIRIAHLDMNDQTLNIQTTVDQAKTRLQDVAEEARNKLARLREIINECHIEYTEFRSKHDLQDRPARYPNSRLLPYALLAAMMLIESIINANLLGEGHEQGLIGGFTTAVAIAFMNVLIFGALGAWGVRRVQHLDYRHRLAGLIVICVFVVAIGVINLMGAHLRVAYGDPYIDNPLTAAFESFRMVPFGIGDVLSWLLALIGVAFAVLAAIDFYKMDDPYPGYGDIDRRLETARDDYEDKEDQLRAEMIETRDRWIENVTEIYESLRRDYAEHARILDHRRQIYEEFRTYHVSLEETANQFLAVYRESNRQMRTTSAPTYFGKKWALPPVPDSTNDGTAGTSNSEQILTKVNKARQAGIQKIIEKCQYLVEVYFDRTDAGLEAGAL